MEGSAMISLARGVPRVKIARILNRRGSGDQLMTNAFDCRQRKGPNQPISDLEADGDQKIDLTRRRW